MRISVLEGSRAEEFLFDEDAERAWRDLLDACPWSTVYQDVPFVRTWCETYRDEWEPVVVLGGSVEDGLDGLLPLARARGDGRLVPLGGREAEYQGWITRPGEAEDFPRKALHEVNGRFPGRDLVFRYLPPATPLQWLDKGGNGFRWSATEWMRPLVRDPAHRADKSLRKKSNKSRLKQMARHGEVKLDRIRDGAELRGLLAQLASWCDLRHGAWHGALPFERDALKGPFLCSLLDAGVLHGSVLTVGGEPASIYLGCLGRGTMHLGVIAHTPFLAKYSPGRFHLYLLARMLGEEEVPVLDMTPGEDPYKERFADSFDGVRELTVHGGLSSFLRDRCAARARKVARKALERAGVEPERVKAFLARARRVRPSSIPAELVRRMRHRLWRDAEYRIYFYDLAANRPEPGGEEVEADSIPAVLSYRPEEAWQTREAFLRQTIKALENGHHIYTVSDAEGLVHYGWVCKESEGTFATEVGQEIRFPRKSHSLWNSYTAPRGRGKKLYQKTMRQTLYDLRAKGCDGRVYAGVLSDNHASRHVVEKVGFTYERSAFERVRFGRTTRWQEDPPE